MIDFAWANAKTTSEAAVAATATVADAMTASSEAPGRDKLSVVKAGGIDLLDLLKERLLEPARIVSLTGIPGLDRIQEAPAGGLRIGAMVTLASLAEHPMARQRYSGLTEALRATANPQIRNVATVGGNLLQRPRCWYLRAQQYRCLRKGGGHCFAIPGENQYHAIFHNGVCAIVHPSTAATALVALGATVELAGPDGNVRRMLLEDFFVAPDRDIQRENDLKAQEILTAIHLPAPVSSARMAYFKQGERDSFDWPLADVAVVLDMAPAQHCRHATVILGAAAPVPHRAKTAEAALMDRRIDENSARQAARAALDGATPLAKNAYKLPLFEALVRRAILQAAAR